jgi:ATP-dependent 26S proteasome regulatory subunit
MDNDPQFPEIQPTIEIERFQCDRVELEILDVGRMRHIVADHQDNTVVVPNSPELPSPMRGSHFSYDPHSRNGTISAGIELDPALVKLNGHDVTSWASDFIDHLEANLEGNMLVDPNYTTRLDHVPNTLYVLVNPDTYAAIYATAEADRCYINVVTHPVEPITKASGMDVPYQEDDEDVQTDPYEALANTAKIWALIHSSALDLFGTLRKKHSKVQLALSVLSREEAMRADESAPTDYSSEYFPGEVPEAEMLTDDDITFSSIGGNKHVVTKLQNIIQLRTPSNLELARSMNIKTSNNGFLLYGPSGTGKTLLMKAFGNELRANVLVINSEEIIDKWVGNSGKNIANLFHQIKASPEPLLVVMDEFDTLGVAPQFTSSDERLDVTNILKREISELADPRFDHIFLAAATNNIDRIDPALIRSGRLEKIYVGLPEQADRADIWACLLHERFKHQDLVVPDMQDGSSPAHEPDVKYAPDVDPTTLAELSEGMSGADIQIIIENAWNTKFMAVVQNPMLDHFVTLAELRKSIEASRKSL